MAYIQKRATQDGKVRFRVQVRKKGHPIQTATFERKTDAHRWAHKIETEISEGRHFKTSHAKRYTVADLIDRYVMDILPRKPKSVETQLGQLRWWREELGQYVLADVTPDLIAKKRDKLLMASNGRGGRISSSSANRYMAVLSHAFSIAIKEWRWLELSPMASLSKLPEPKGRVRFLDEEERRRLLEACRQSGSRHLYPVVVLALATGARKGNILRLEWDDVDLDRGLLIFQDTKGGERKGIPLRGRALEVLSRILKERDPHSPYVFPSDNGTSPTHVTTAWRTAVCRAGLQNFRFHDLRHTTASYLAMGGATPLEIAEVLGHRSLEMTMRYSHLADSHVSSIIERLDQKMFGNEPS